MHGDFNKNGTMNLQYITDHTGKTAGVFIPLQEWEALKARFIGLEEEEPGEQSKEEILQGLKQAVEQMNLVKQDRLKARPARELLDEL